MESIRSARDLLLFELANTEKNLHKTIADISEDAYDWEPIPMSERQADLLLPPERKRVWRVYVCEGVWTYDYTPAALRPPPFTTIAWLMNHIAQTAEMYLLCIKTQKPEGVVKRWEDLPVPPNLSGMSERLFKVLASVHDFLLAIPAVQANHELNRLTPAPSGEMRPTYLNIWGGIIEHAIQHDMQINTRKDYIYYDYYVKRQ